MHTKYYLNGGDSSANSPENLLFKKSIIRDIEANPTVLFCYFAKPKQDWMAHPVFDYSIKNPLTKVILEEILADYSGWHWLHPKKFELAIPEAKDRLTEIKVRTMIGVGEYDLEYFHDIARYMASAITGSMYVKIPNAGHMSNLDNAVFVNELIKNNCKQD